MRRIYLLLTIIILITMGACNSKPKFEDIDGYAFGEDSLYAAEHLKSELIGNKIYIKGNVENIDHYNYAWLYLHSGNAGWFCSLDEIDADGKKLVEIKNILESTPVTVFGEYKGFTEDDHNGTHADIKIDKIVAENGITYYPKDFEKEPSNTEKLLNKAIDFEGANSATLMVVKENSELQGAVVCNFDGTEPKIEYIRMSVLTAILEELDVPVITVAVQSGEEAGIYRFEDNILSPLSMPVPKYVGLNPDFSSTDALLEIQFIGENLQDVSD